MSRLLSARGAGGILIGALLIMLAVHVLILMRALPYTMVWGGQIQSVASLVSLESTAIGMTVLFILVICLRVGYIRTSRWEKVSCVGSWAIFVYFVLNTAGNLASGVTLEKLFFTPVTVLLTLLALRVATDK